MARPLLRICLMAPPRTLLSSILGVLLLTGSVPAVAGAQTASPKVDRAVRESQQSGAPTQTVIISVQAGYRDTLKQALQKHGDAVISETSDALTVELHSSDVDEIANQPWIESVAADAAVYAGSVKNLKDARTVPSVERASSFSPALKSLPGVKNVLRATLGLSTVASPGAGGSGVGVAIVDSGISPSDDFAGRITAFYDFTRNGKVTTPFDDYGHGTHIAGLVGSSG